MLDIRPAFVQFPAGVNDRWGDAIPFALFSAATPIAHVRSIRARYGHQLERFETNEHMSAGAKREAMFHPKSESEGPECDGVGYQSNELPTVLTVSKTMPVEKKTNSRTELLRVPQLGSNG